MRYVSTRGRAGSVDFEGALLSGYARDGGLFMPQKIPVLDCATLKKWSTFSYPELVKQLCSIFISPELIPKEELNDLIDRAFSRFRHKDVVNLSRLKNGLNVLELWHGVTYAFKDLSLSCTGQFLQYFLKKKKKHVTILVGTSGDTGSSAIESVRAEGNSDEIDEPIKELFADDDFSRRHNLMSLNSINWSRILVQIAHYFYAYFRCAPSVDATPLPVVEIVVPTGGGGNLTAGCLAQKMGLPIDLVAVVNNNDIVHRAIQHGDLSLSRNLKPTLASAMDIQEPYNMERIFWLFSGSDSNLVKSLMEDFYTTKTVKLPLELQKKLSGGLRSYSVSDEEIVRTMRCCWEENHYLLCPHTAVAVSYHYKHSSCHPSICRCCLAPASPVKFEDAVLKADLTLDISPEISMLKDKETRSCTLKRGDDWAKLLRHQIEAVTKQRNLTLS
ncbi:threonine synthase-like 2 isoform X2 [Rhineura floridana]|uniref:threonine synthase-like 2 isoform X2 n=1 Tax=Rhineura floridana TaxID=261503 RepID=UPI002AC82DFB|nr:threonine synthase-like 2 isoform X2 [Rhineura floridana]